ncbi:MAG: VOC family protein [Bacteroidota bacterium]
MNEQPEKQFSHAATVLGVSDIMQGVAFYRDKLGFEDIFLWGDPVDYAVLTREDTVSIHLTQDAAPVIPQYTALYIFVHDVDALFAELTLKGVNIPNAPETLPYDMREFDLQDPFGYRLTFGTHISRIAQSSRR